MLDVKVRDSKAVLNDMFRREEAEGSSGGGGGDGVVDFSRGLTECTASMRDAEGTASRGRLRCLLGVTLMVTGSDRGARCLGGRRCIPFLLPGIME